MICENAATQGRAIFTPRCFGNRAEWICRVVYHHAESDVLYLCGECRTVLMREARRHRYRVRPRPVKDERIRETLQKLLALFESGELPAAVARTVIRPRGDRPCDRWSLGNRIIMYLNGTQDARGYRQWEAAGRRVKKGARAFYILAPVTKKVVRKVEDPETGEEREEERVVVVGFRDVPVFRYEDTEGEPLPDYSPPEPPPLFEVAARFGLKVEYRPHGGRVYGLYDFRQDRIVLETHDPETFFHELAHAAHHRVKPGGLAGGQNPEQEIVAEVAAAALCELYGYRGYLPHAWEYVRAYARGEPKAALRAVMGLLGEVEAVLRLVLEPEGGEETCRTRAA